MKVLSPHNPGPRRAGGAGRRPRIAITGLLAACTLGLSLATPAAHAADVHNTPPTITIEQPTNGKAVSNGLYVGWKFTVTDREDSTIDCGHTNPSRAKVHLYLELDGSVREYGTLSGCNGTFLVWLNEERARSSHMIFEAEYTDMGGAVTRKRHLLPISQIEHCKNSHEAKA